jgi:glycosyltransferase involved in cell wall biosynthesis
LVNTLYSPFGVGGAGRSVRELAESLVLDGHAVQVNTLAPSDFSAPAEVINGVRVRRHRSASSFGPFDRTSLALGPVRKTLWHANEASRRHARSFLDASFDEFQPDVVHSNNIAGFGLAVWVAAGETPLVHTMRDYYLLCARSQLYRDGALCTARCISCTVLKMPVRLARRVPDLYVGVSQDILDRHRSMGALAPEAQTAVVHNWPSLAGSPALHPASSSEGKLRFGVLGRIGDDKGTWKVIEAFRALPDSVRQNSSLSIVGSASVADERRLQDAVSEIDGLQYLGHHMDPQAFFDQIDIALIPSQWFEPFGRVAAEARMAGIGVIASRAGGLPEAVEQFGGGILVDDFQSAEAWTSAMAQAALSRTPHSAFAPVARPTVSAQYLDHYRAAGAGDSK